MKKLSAYLLIALACFANCYSQPTDSLKFRLNRAEGDSLKVTLLARLGFEYAFIDLDTARSYSHMAIAKAEEINFNKGKADALNNLAISYDVEGNHEQAVNYFLQALTIYEQIGTKEGLAKIYNNCGMVYQSLGNTTKSLKYHYQSLKTEKEIGDPIGIAYSLTQIASIHLQSDSYDSALYYYSAANEILIEQDDVQGLAYVNWGLGELYSYTGEYEKAKDHSMNAYQYFEKEENHKGMSETSLIMGRTYLNQQLYTLAENHILKALTISEQLEAKNVILECLISLYTLHKAQANFNNALVYHERYTDLKNVVLKEEMTSNIEEIESRYNFEKQQQQIELLNKENSYQTQIRNISIGVAIIVGFLLVLLYWAYLSKSKTMEALKKKNDEIEKKNAIIEIEKKNALAAAEAKAEFLSVMSHEIRTPMNVVIGSIYLLMEDDPKPHQIENLNMLKFSAENLLTLLNDILDLNKLEAGQLELESVPFDLNFLVRGISEGYGAEARKKGIGFNLLIDSDVPNKLIGDPGRLTQVLNNLISNGIKFTEEGTVTFAIQLLKKGRKKTKLKFIVEDTGIGIPAGLHDEIFENFKQANSDTTRKYGGSGLGLSITKHILELFGSDIELESEPNIGSRFSFKMTFRNKSILEKSKVTDY